MNIYETMTRMMREEVERLQEHTNECFCAMNTLRIYYNAFSSKFKELNELGELIKNKIRETNESDREELYRNLKTIIRAQIDMCCPLQIMREMYDTMRKDDIIEHIQTFVDTIKNSGNDEIMQYVSKQIPTLDLFPEHRILKNLGIR